MDTAPTEIYPARPTLSLHDALPISKDIVGVVEEVGEVKSTAYVVGAGYSHTLPVRRYRDDDMTEVGVDDRVAVVTDIASCDVGVRYCAPICRREIGRAHV